MHDHDLDLIAAFIEGRLVDETEARALIASSAEARAEYEIQKLAYESLRSMGTANLTEKERAALHRDVWTELRTETSAKQQAPWYYRWVPVAAGLFVIVGLVTVLSGGGDEMAATFDEIASGLGGDGEGDAAATTTAAGATDRDSAQDDAGADSAPTETTEAMSADTTTAAESFSAAPAYEDEAARVREGEFTEPLQSYEEAGDGNVEACLEQADFLNYRPVATVTRPDPEASDLEEVIVVAAPEGVVLAEATLAFIDLDTCELVYLDERPR